MIVNSLGMGLWLSFCQTGADVPAQLPVTKPVSRLIFDEPAKIADPVKPDGKKADDGKPEEDKKEEPKKEPEKGFFMQALDGTPLGQRLECNKITVSGWTQMSFTGSSARRSNLPVTFNDGANEYQLNQNFLRIDKPIDTEKKEVQLGGRIEAILPGTDARFTVPRGLFDNQLRNGNNGGPRPYPIDIYQMYTELYLPDLGEGTSVKFGRFATHCEYEVTQGAETPFLSRSYTFQYNPFTHTGVYATTQLNDDWSVGNGLAVGSDNFIDNTNRPTYLGQLKYAPKDGKTTVLFNTVIGATKFDRVENFPNYNVFNFQVIQKLNEKLTYVFDGTYSYMRNVPNAGGIEWYGVVNWLQYQMCDKLAANLRVELFEDASGFRTGSRGTYFETTYGYTWTPKDWLLVRPFARYDHNDETRAFEGKKNLYTGGIDLIVKW